MVDEGIVKRVNTETLSMHQELLSIAEVLQTFGEIALPPDPERTTARTDLLIVQAQQGHFFDTLAPQSLQLPKRMCTT